MLLLLFSRLGAHASARWGCGQRNGILFHSSTRTSNPNSQTRRERRSLGPEPRTVAAFRTRTARPADSSAPSDSPFLNQNVPVPRQNNAQNTVCPKATTEQNCSVFVTRATKDTNQASNAHQNMSRSESITRYMYVLSHKTSEDPILLLYTQHKTSEVTIHIQSSAPKLLPPTTLAASPERERPTKARRLASCRCRYPVSLRGRCSRRGWA